MFWASSCRAAAYSVASSALACEVADAAFTWLTNPSSPGEKTRTETLVLVTPSWVAPAVALPDPDTRPSDVALAVAPPVARLSWVTPSSSPALPTLTTTAVLETPDCPAPASALASCWTVVDPAVSPTVETDASASAADRFSWPTFLPLPGSSIRTATDVFSTSRWPADADASAFWSTDAF